MNIVRLDSAASQILSYLGVDRLLRWVLHDEGGELVSHVEDVLVATGFTGGSDHVLPHLK